MSITTDNGPWEYTASAAATTFAYLNKIYAESDLLVTVDGVTKTLSDYDVTGVGVAAGGSVVFGTPMVGGEAVVIASAIPISQSSDLLDNGRFPAAQVTDLVDKPIRILQQIEGIQDRSLRVAATEDVLTELPDAATRAGKVVLFDGAGDATVGTPSSTVISQATESTAGIAELATQTEVNTGTDDLRMVTPLKLAGRTATEARAGVVELATTGEAVTGTDTARAVTAAGVAAAIAAGTGALGWRPLARFVPTAAATFTISGASYFATTYSRLRLNLQGIRPATDNDDLRLRVSIAASVKSGASDYAWQYKIMAITSSTEGSSNDGADTEMEIAENIGNAASESLSGVIELCDPASTAIVKQISWRTTYFNGATQIVHCNGEGAYIAGLEALDALVFHWQSGGNFAAVGECFLEGLKTS